MVVYFSNVKMEMLRLKNKFFGKRMLAHCTAKIMNLCGIMNKAIGDFVSNEAQQNRQF